MKGAFLNAKIPDGKLVIVQPPAQWIKWGLVPPGVTWTLDKAVYGLRESPALWGEERDRVLRNLSWSVKGESYNLEQCSGDSQIWYVRKEGESTTSGHTVRGRLVVYVDDFLLHMSLGDVRDGLLAAIKDVGWKLAKEAILDINNPITFLGIDIIEFPSGDLKLYQERFTDTLLSKHHMEECTPIRSVTMGPIPT